MRSVSKMLVAAGKRIEFPVRQTLFFGNVSYNVATEPVAPSVQPVLDYILYFLAYLGVVPVEVGLLTGEKVQVKFVGSLVVFPRGPPETAGPVVGHFFLVLSLPFSPDIIVVIGIIAAFLCLLKPEMFVAGMVADQVHN